MVGNLTLCAGSGVVYVCMEVDRQQGRQQVHRVVTHGRDLLDYNQEWNMLCYDMGVERAGGRVRAPPPGGPAGASPCGML